VKIHFLYRIAATAVSISIRSKKLIESSYLLFFFLFIQATKLNESMQHRSHYFREACVRWDWNV